MQVRAERCIFTQELKIRYGKFYDIHSLTYLVSYPLKLAHSASLSGHEDWVKCLAFTQLRHSPPQLTLASGSQDGTIRLWSIDPITSSQSRQSVNNVITAFDASIADYSEMEEGGRQLSTKHHIIAIKSFDGRSGKLHVSVRQY